jgi:hypothetical protein
MQIVGINKLCTRPGCTRPADSDAANEAVVSPLTDHDPALSGAPSASRPLLREVDCLLRPNVFCREGSLITNFYSEIAAFLIGTLPIRIVLNSFRIIARATSNRHSPETIFRSNLAGAKL